MSPTHHSNGLLTVIAIYGDDIIITCDDAATITQLKLFLDAEFKILAHSGELITDPTAYRRLIGKLNYLTHTRPDLSYVVKHLYQFMQELRLLHFIAALHLVRYLRINPGQDWGSCVDT
uniref:Reverse transcriptase Ty1/copia-type domain-containing protein n=1 Tax=Solanum lycopersicum TaxID=4081 RepID=A0A3Q7GSD2_SOLLC